jgi:signal transduction histidine kinase
MDLRRVRDDVVQLVVGGGLPAGSLRRPRWLGPYRWPVLLLLTVALGFAAKASVNGASPAGQLVAVLGAAPLAIMAIRPLIAWRVAWIAAVLSAAFPSPHETAWPWAPVTVFVYLAALFAAAATQRLGVTVGIWVATCVLVVWETNQNNVAGVVILVTVLVLAGDQVRRRARAQRNLVAEEERSVVLAERTRIARELHDVVAHHMSMIAVRAETAPYRLHEVGAAARTEFGEISTAAREALVEMRRLLGVLRSEQHEALTAPQPGLADLAELVEGARRAGATIDLDVADDVPSASPAVELTAYRIVQEALSNAGQHAPGARTAVAVGRTAASLTVVVNTGRAQRPDHASAGRTAPPRVGHGLSGMRERATSLGGELAAGPLADGGFTVRAVLPLSADVDLEAGAATVTAPDAATASGGAA